MDEDSPYGTLDVDGSKLVSYDEETGVGITLQQLMENDSRSDNIPTYFSWMDNGKVQYTYDYEWDYNGWHYTSHVYAYMP